MACLFTTVVWAALLCWQSCTQSMLPLYCRCFIFWNNDHKPLTLPLNFHETSCVTSTNVPHKTVHRNGKYEFKNDPTS
eukprot:4600481-Amphidinium_carterae.1